MDCIHTQSLQAELHLIKHRHTFHLSKLRSCKTAKAIRQLLSEKAVEIG